MLSFTGSLRVFRCVEAADMRKGFEGLHALGGERLGEDVRGGRSLFSPISGTRASKSFISTAPECGS